MNDSSGFVVPPGPPVPPPPGPSAQPRYPAGAEPAYGPAYGSAPAPGHGWQRQQPLFHAYKPGIIRLQALGLGDILDGAVRSVRFNPRSMVGLALIVLAAFLVPSAALSVAGIELVRRLTVTTDDAAALASLPGLVGVALFGQLATVVLTGLLIHVVGEAVLGRRPGLGQTWRAVRGRLLPLLGLNLLVGLVVLVAGVLLLGPGVLLLTTDQVGVGVVALVLGLLAYAAVLVWVAVKTMLAGPVLVLERTGIRAALRRSWVLVRGAFWRTFGIMLLASVIAAIVSSLLQIPFSIASALLVGLSGTGLESGLLGSTFINHLASLVSGAITTPFVAAVVGLLYIDRRIRLEALDVVLVRAAQGGPPAAGPQDARG